MKFCNWLDRWLIVYIKPFVKERTFLCYEMIINSKIKPALGELELSDLSLSVLQDFGVDLYKNYSANTVRLINFVLNNALFCATKEGLVSHFEKLKNPRLQEKKVECFSLAEQKKIEEFVLNSRKTKYYGIILALYTGLRIGELMALEWSDVNLQKAIIYVNKNCRDKWFDSQYEKIFSTPKTANSQRIIPLPRQIIPLLSLLKKQSKSSFVVSGNYGEEVSIRSYQNTFSRILIKLNIPHKGFHALRHTFATRALECGMDIKTLSEIMGHGNPTITLKRYAHSLMEHKTEMMNKLGKLYLGTLSGKTQ